MTEVLYFTYGNTVDQTILGGNPVTVSKNTFEMGGTGFPWLRTAF